MERAYHDLDSGWQLFGVAAAVERTVGALDPEVVEGDYPALSNAVAFQSLKAMVNAHNPSSLRFLQPSNSALIAGVGRR